MTVIKKYKEDILYYEIEGFSLDNNVSHLFSTRIGWEQNKLFNNLTTIFNITEDNVYRIKQVHGTEVLIIKDQNNISASMEERDGLITSKKGIALCTYHADCVPIYYYDKVNEVIGLAHAGWKGTLNNINEVIIKNMIKHFNSSPENIMVAIGPSIGACCYEIGHDVELLFRDKYPKELNIISKRENKIYLDLWKMNLINLLNLGIRENNIICSDYCTSCNANTLYSYRKEKGIKSRMIAAIMLNE